MDDRDELLRQIGERVVERVDEEGYRGAGLKTDICVVCDGWVMMGDRTGPGHDSGCELTRYLEATDDR